MKLDYSYKPDKDKILVGYVTESVISFYDGIYDEMCNFAQRYGICLRKDTDIDKDSSDSYEVKHAIIISSSNDPEVLTRSIEHLLNWYYSMSVVLVYDNKEQMLSNASMIENLKVKYDDRINYLRPDEFLKTGQCVVSKQKILDNTICDTIRIKYQPNRISDHIVDIPASVKDFFVTASTYYTDYKLYHRTPSDGFFAVRNGDGFYITATKTHKSPLNLERISFVHGYDEENNSLSYSGQYLPSSDVVEASFVFKEHPKITALVHTHASDKYTRNENFSHKVKVGKVPYGTPELGKNISSVISDYYDDFIILEEHGELFALTGEPKKGMARLENLLLEEA